MDSTPPPRPELWPYTGVKGRRYGAWNWSSWCANVLKYSTSHVQEENRDANSSGKGVSVHIPSCPGSLSTGLSGHSQKRPQGRSYCLEGL
jgi:hypothetical protein